MPANWKTYQWPQDWKRSVFIPIPKKGYAKECSNYCTILLISHPSKVMLKIFKLGINNMWTGKLQMYKLDLEKAEEPEIKLPTSTGLSKKQGNLKKTYFCSIDYTKKPWLWIITNCGKFLKRWEYQTTLPASCKTCLQVKKLQLELDMGQWTGSKLGKEYFKAVYCHPAYLTSMQSTSCEMLGWMKHKLKSRLLGKISATSDMQTTTLMAESEEELKNLSVKVKKDWKNWLKTQYSKNKDHGI